MQKISKISSKGQITLPKAVRDKLGSETVRVVWDANGVRIEPVQELAGSLKNYATGFVTVTDARQGAERAAIDNDDPRY